MPTASHFSNRDMITKAAEVLKRHTTTEGRLFGDVAAALVSENGNLYLGVCLDTPSWGLCAERSAIAAMVTAGEYRISKIVAVWTDPDNGNLHVLPPCGICREFMLHVDRGNLDSGVILDTDKVVSLKDLLPHHEWPEPVSLA